MMAELAITGLVDAARSFLFTPASSARMLAKLASSSADAVVVDFEDGVAADRKQDARDGYLAHYDQLRTSPPILVVRVNGVDSPEHDADLHVIARARPDALVIPKATRDSVDAVAELALPLIAAIETAEAVSDAARIAAGAQVMALTIGAADLAAELGTEDRADRHHLLFIRSKLVLDSATARLRRPIDAVFMDVKDGSGLAAECNYAHSLGFGGKACIHPAQVPTINASFCPSEQALEWARRVVDAYDEALGGGAGAVSVDGQLVDLPVAVRARSLLGLNRASVAS